MEEGTFVPDGRNDILTEAIGTAEHGGRVRGVGQNHTLSTFFGRSSSRQRQVIDVQEQIAQITSNVEARIKSDLDKKFAEERKMIEEERKMFAEERKMMQQSFMDTLKSMGLSQTSEINKVIEPASPKVVVTGSAKGSCSPAYEKDN
jgi:aspartate-semialdehyde dehydrogenase